MVMYLCVLGYSSLEGSHDFIGFSKGRSLKGRSSQKCIYRADVHVIPGVDFLLDYTATRLNVRCPTMVACPKARDQIVSKKCANASGVFPRRGFVSMACASLLSVVPIGDAACACCSCSPAALPSDHDRCAPCCPDALPLAKQECYFLRLSFLADGFLPHMIRRIVGTLRPIGEGTEVTSPNIRAASVQLYMPPAPSY